MRACVRSQTSCVARRAGGSPAGAGGAARGSGRRAAGTPGARRRWSTAAGALASRAGGGSPVRHDEQAPPRFAARKAGRPNKSVMGLTFASARADADLALFEKLGGRWAMLLFTFAFAREELNDGVGIFHDMSSSADAISEYGAVIIVAAALGAYAARLATDRLLRYRDGSGGATVEAVRRGLVAEGLDLLADSSPMGRFQQDTLMRESIDATVDRDVLPYLPDAVEEAA